MQLLRRVAPALLVSLACCGPAATNGPPTTAETQQGNGQGGNASSAPQATFPALDRAWSGADYEATAAVLGAMVNERPGALPRLGDAATSGLFQHMLSRSHLAPLQSPAILVGQRVQEAMRVHGSLGQWLSAYLNALGQGHAYQTEIVEIIGLTVVSSELVLVVLGEFVSTLPPEEANTPERQAGLAQVLRGLHQTVVGVVSSFLPPDRGVFGTGPLVRLAELVTPVLPRLVVALPAESRQQVAEIVGTAVAQEQAPELRAALLELQAALGASQTTGPGGA